MTTPKCSKCLDNTKRFKLLYEVKPMLFECLNCGYIQLQKELIIDYLDVKKM